MWVVKLGGSVFDAPRLQDWLDLFAERGGAGLVVVPGGGRFADAVRDAQRRLRFDARAAHDMALLAMAQSARMLHALQPRLRLVEGVDDVRAAWRDGVAALWQPFDVLREAPADVPSSWDVTSDSLAAWLATRLQARHLVLVKWDRPPKHQRVAELVEAGYVDRAFDRYAQRYAGPIGFVSRDALATVRGWLDAENDGA